MRTLPVVLYLTTLFCSTGMAQTTEIDRARAHCTGSDAYRAAYNCDCIAKKFEVAWAERGTRGWETIYNNVFTDARECAVPDQIAEAAKTHCEQQYSSLYHLFDTSKLGEQEYCSCVGTASARVVGEIEPIYIYQLPRVHKLATDACTK